MQQTQQRPDYSWRGIEMHKMPPVANGVHFSLSELEQRESGSCDRRLKERPLGLARRGVGEDNSRADSGLPALRRREAHQYLRATTVGNIRC